jgi:uncharacterized membrane protein
MILEKENNILLIHNMAFPRSINELCTPAYVYFIISVIGIVLMAIQNLGNSTRYCLGSFACEVPSTIMVFVVKILYVMFWAWLLNLMCKDGHKNIAWFLVILPIVLFAVIIGMLMMYQNDKKSKQKKPSGCNKR